MQHTDYQHCIILGTNMVFPNCSNRYFDNLMVLKALTQNCEIRLKIVKIGHKGIKVR